MIDEILAKTKLAFHKRQANLPFETKIRAVVRMQQRARDLRIVSGREPNEKHLPIWILDEEDEETMIIRNQFKESILMGQFREPDFLDQV